MALLALLVILIVAGLGLALTPLYFAAGGLFVFWAVGWVVKVKGGHWYFW
jgi:hypothetical protein